MAKADGDDDKAPTGGPRTPPSASVALAGNNAYALLSGLIEDFFVARKLLKGSPHTEAAYRADLAGISAQARRRQHGPGMDSLGPVLRLPRGR